MDAQTDIAQRIEKIREIFQHAYAISTDQEDLDLLIDQLEKTENDYRSIAYEATSVAIAVKDFLNGNTLNYWHSFLKDHAAQHAVQIHTGLGWAIAQQRISISPIIETLDPLMQFRMLDGFGYYYGIFRRRQIAGGQPFSTDVESKFIRGYDQGVGRSLWYISKGDYASVPEKIAQFSSSRHTDLWRGIGIACTYVGGCDEFILKELLSLSFPYHAQLAVGAALVASSRNSAGTITKDVELACRVWCKQSIQEVLLITEKAETSLVAGPNNAYFIWLSEIEKKLGLESSSTI
jgi:hypothetical protein